MASCRSYGGRLAFRLIGKNTPVSVNHLTNNGGRQTKCPTEQFGRIFMMAKLMAVVALTVATASVALADEPKHGGILHIYHRETPPSLSIHEEATFSVNVPAMGLFNNLAIYDQHKPQNNMGDIVPELATSWAWDSAGTALTFKLREGVTWHDGKPFTAKDVKCTFDLLQDKAQDKFR